MKFFLLFGVMNSHSIRYSQIQNMELKMIISLSKQSSLWKKGLNTGQVIRYLLKKTKSEMCRAQVFETIT